MHPDRRPPRERIRTVSRSTIGWVWVAGQVVLLGALIVAPGGDAWAKPDALTLTANLLFFGGLALVGAAAAGLGRALTPTPVPTEAGRLTTTGLYRFVRHPIYTGVLAVVAGITLRSGSWLHLALAAATVVFFDRKAAWEERALRDRYPDYGDYAARTPKFVPRIARR